MQCYFLCSQLCVSLGESQSWLHDGRHCARAFVVAGLLEPSYSGWEHLIDMPREATH